MYENINLNCIKIFSKSFLRLKQQKIVKCTLTIRLENIICNILNVKLYSNARYL